MTDHPSIAPLSFAATDDGEELARAELYGLLARLWLAPPDAALLQQFRVAVTAGAGARRPARGALAGAGGGDARDHRGRGRRRARRAVPRRRQARGLCLRLVLPHRLPQREAAGALRDRPAAARAWRATRSALETEDHVAYVFEVMRYLIAGDDVAVCNLEQQRRFFRAHLQPWVEALCDAVEAHPRADTWRARGGLHARLRAGRDAGLRHARSMTPIATERHHRPRSSPAAAAAAWAASTRACRTTTACRWRCTRCCACSRRWAQLMINANRNLGAYESMGVPVWPDADRRLPRPAGRPAGRAGALRDAATW